MTKRRRCCCDGTSPCPYCTTLPTDMQLVLAGFADEAGSSCPAGFGTSFNGTYTLSLSNPGLCVYSYSFGETGSCSRTSLAFRFDGVASAVINVSWVKSTGAPASAVLWTPSLPIPADCTGLSSETYNYVGSSGNDVDLSSATISVTSL